jgi:hypothetical protein
MWMSGIIRTQSAPSQRKTSHLSEPEKRSDISLNHKRVGINLTQKADKKLRHP